MGQNEFHKIQLNPAQPVSQGLEESVLLPRTQARGFESLKKMLKIFLLVGKVECNLFSDQVDSKARPSGLQKTPVPASQPASQHSVTHQMAARAVGLAWVVLQRLTKF